MNELKYLTTIKDEVTNHLLLSELEFHNISIVKKPKNEVLNIYAGQSTYGIDLYVTEEDYDIAITIVNDLNKTYVDKGFSVKQNLMAMISLFTITAAILYFIFNK